ncbi:hypothetical protein [Bacillus litorisediminis]|nr:hypothetical protein [Bacillus litorisediminis]
MKFEEMIKEWLQVNIFKKSLFFCTNSGTSVRKKRQKHKSIFFNE